MQAIVTTFHLDWSLLIAQAINFGVVAVILWKFAFRPLAKLLEERAGKIERGLADAAAAQTRLAAAGEEAKEIIAAARRDGTAALETARVLAEKLKTEEVAAAKQEVEKTLVAGKAALVAEQELMLKNFRAAAAELVVAAAGKALTEAKHPGVDESLAKRALAELGTRK